MSTWKELWMDEGGALVSAELVTVGTLAVVGTTVGLNTLATGINGELTDLAKAFRSLDQSYTVRGFRSCRASTADSSYTQQPVEQALVDLCGDVAPVKGPQKKAAPAKGTTVETERLPMQHSPAVPESAVEDADVPTVPAEVKLHPAT